MARSTRSLPRAVRWAIIIVALAVPVGATVLYASVDPEGTHIGTFAALMSAFTLLLVAFSAVMVARARSGRATVDRRHTP